MSGVRRADWLEEMRLVVITTPVGEPRMHEEVAAAALRAGCRAIQLRDKEMGDAELTAVALELKEMCSEAGAVLLINDRIEVAEVVASDGVHLGVGDMTVKDARRFLPARSIIGYSPEGPADARAAIERGADYLGVGPVFATQTKPDAGGPIGPEGLSPYVTLAPVIAVGGITADNTRLAIGAGASGVAVASAVSAAADMEEAARRILEAVDAALEKRKSGD